jgi:uncharacterized protein (DUF2062 family)
MIIDQRKKPRMKLRETIAKSVKLLVNSNLSPKKLALTIALGVTLGAIPLLWGASILCVVGAWALRLNQVCLQVVNYLAWPLQLALLIPFYRHITSPLSRLHMILP